MHQTVVFALLLAVTVSYANSQKINFGGCPDVQVQQNLDLNKYTGVWYEIQKNPVPFEAGLKCNQANYTNQGDYVTVVNKGVNKRTGEVSTIEGKATIPDKSVPAKLKVQFNGMPFDADYWILSTDYNQYSVVYSCYSLFNVFNGEFLWILSRTPTLDQSTINDIYKFLDDNEINRKGLTKTEQDC